VGSIYARWYGL